MREPLLSWNQARRNPQTRYKRSSVLRQWPNVLRHLAEASLLLNDPTAWPHSGHRTSLPQALDTELLRTGGIWTARPHSGHRIWPQNFSQGPGYQAFACGQQPHSLARFWPQNLLSRPWLPSFCVQTPPAQPGHILTTESSLQALATVFLRT